jgi:hypothetical protein
MFRTLSSPRSRSAILTAILTSACLGCGSKEDLPKPVAVTGKVTSDKKPMSGVTVGFTAISKGLPARYRYVQSTTDAEGNYSMATVYPAEYQVTLNKAGAAAPEADPQKVAVNPADPELAKFGIDSPLRANVSSTATKFDFDTKQK